MELRLANVTKRYGAGVAVDGIDLTFASGRTTALLGPRALLPAEPLSALDPPGRTELGEDLRAIFRSLAKTVVVVTHDVGEAAHLADVVVLMRAGRVVQQGPFASLASAPADPFVT